MALPGGSAEGLQGLVLTAAASALLVEHSRNPIAAAALESLMDDTAAEETFEGTADRPDPSDAFRLGSHGSVRPACCCLASLYHGCFITGETQPVQRQAADHVAA